MIRIKILGSECKKCRQFEENVRIVVSMLGIEAFVEKVTDFEEIIKYGVVYLPALVIDEKVESVGVALKKNSIKILIENRS